MKRSLEPFIINDLESKIVLLSGPRQCGKTTLSKQLFERYDYINYDALPDRLIIKNQSWDRSSDLIIFDELHKMRNWKQWLKGVYDKEGIPPALIVTGSSKLNTYRKVGDSLAGRYFHYALHPLCLKEATQCWKNNPEEIYQRLMTVGGFPEPFLKGDLTYYKRWRSTHLDIILKQDLMSEYAVRDIQSIEMLIYLLQERVGSPVSYANLACDLERDPKTIKRWLTMLENLYVIFKVTPYHKNISRSLLKEPKYYFYDNARVTDANGPRLENLVACALLKELDRLKDIQGINGSLHYLRTKDGKEIDFLIVLDKKPCYAIEVKSSDARLSPHFKHYAEYLKNCEFIQLVTGLERKHSYPQGFKIENLVNWLSSIDLSIPESNR